MDHAAARVDDIRDITETLFSGGNEQGFAGLTDHAARVVMVQQGRANAVFGASGPRRASRVASRPRFRGVIRNCRSG